MDPQRYTSTVSKHALVVCNYSILKRLSGSVKLFEYQWFILRNPEMFLGNIKRSNKYREITNSFAGIPHQDSLKKASK